MVRKLPHGVRKPEIPCPGNAGLLSAWGRGNRWGERVVDSSVEIRGSERRAPTGAGPPGLPPPSDCQGPQRLRGQGRPQAVAAAIAQRPLMPEGRPRNLRGASPLAAV